MQPARRVAKQNVALACLETCRRIEHHRCRIRAFAVLNYLHPAALRPNGELLRRRRAERIRRGHHGLPAFRNIVRRKFAYGCGFTNAVNANYQQNRRPLVRGKFAVRPHFVRNYAPKFLPCFGAGFNALFAKAVPQRTYKPFGSIHAHVGDYHGFLKFFIEFVIHALPARKYRAKHAVSGLAQAFLQLFKKAHLLFHSSSLSVESGRHHLGDAPFFHCHAIKRVADFHTAFAVGYHNKLSIL